MLPADSRRCAVVVLVVVVAILHLTLPAASGTPFHVTAKGGPPVGERKVKRESDAVATYGRGVPKENDEPFEPFVLPDESDSGEEVIYDQRQVNGETNIRLNIKNFQLRLPESQLDQFQKSDMAQLIRNSVLRLLGIPLFGGASGSTGGSALTITSGSLAAPLHEEVEEEQQRPQQTESLAPVNPPLQQEQEQHPLPLGSASMLQVNGNNLPAKFFLEISDFLMNTNDNDAVDDQRVETNHNEQQQQQQQQEQTQTQKQRPATPPAMETPAPLYAMEEIMIERVENSNRVKNETITISKRITHVAPVPPNGTALETVRTENRFTSNATRNSTENEDRFVQTKPIRLDTVVMARLETHSQGQPQTLREKVIWRMPTGDSNPDGAE